MTLAHNGHNDIADSAQPRAQLGDREVEHGGISAFGKQVIEEMNRLGIMVDVSHISKPAMLDAVTYSRAPIMASHSSARALCDHPRNMDEEQLLALKANGGVIQMVALGSYVRQDTTERQRALRALRAQFGSTPTSAPLPVEQQTEYEQRLRMIDETWPAAAVEDFVDHIDYAVGLIGIDYVGISSDFDGGGGVVGWNDASETFNVTLELVRRGYREADIAKIWGGNLLRALREVERVAREFRGIEGSRQ
jgi:membrane dipeptidase